MDSSKIIVKVTEWISRMAILNLSWLLYSLPIITIVPATDALFDVMDGRKLGETESVFRLFTRSFKKNFKRSYIFGLPIFLIGTIIVADILFLRALNLSAAGFQLFKYAFYTLSVLYVLGALFAYPLWKRIRTTILKTFLMGLMMAVGHPLISLGLLGSMGVLILILLRWPALFFFFSASVPVWLSTKAVYMAASKMQEKAFHFDENEV